MSVLAVLYKNFYICTLMHICLFFKKWRQRSDSDFRLSTFNSLQGCLPFKKKFRKFRMEGKRLKGHFSEIPTENWGVRFEVVRSFRLVRTKRILLTIYQFITLSGLEKALLPLFSFIFEEVSIFTCQFERIFRSQIKLFCQTHDRIAVTSLVYGNDD